MSSCSACGADLSSASRFCPRCGHAAGDGVAAERDPDGGYWAAVGRRDGPLIHPPTSEASTRVRVDPAPHPVSTGAPGSRRRVGVDLAVVAAACVVLGVAVLGGYLFFSRDDGGGRSPSSTEPDDPAPGTDGGSTPAGTGEVVRPASTSASCVGDDSRDAAGRTTTYRPEHVHDGAGDTAWRCNVRGVGESLTFTFDQPITLASVGLLPGIAKVDPADGSDRFVQNDRVARVLWRFDDGQVEQSFTDERRVQSIDVGVTTRSVTVEIVAVTPGTAVRNEAGAVQSPTGKTPVAEVELRGQPAG